MRRWRSKLQSKWGMRLLWLVPLLSLVFETDLTALIWIGTTLIALIFVPAARQATLAMVYRNVPLSLAIGTAIGGSLALLLDPWLEPALEAWTGSKIDLSQLEKLPGDPGQYVVWLILGMGFGGFWEELSFRGYFVGWGTKLFGNWTALPLTLGLALVFGAGHMYQDLPGAISTGISGLIFGLTYLACDRKLLPAITAHAVANFIGVTQIYLYGL